MSSDARLTNWTSKAHRELKTEGKQAGKQAYEVCSLFFFVVSREIKKESPEGQATAGQGAV